MRHSTGCGDSSDLSLTKHNLLGHVALTQTNALQEKHLPQMANLNSGVRGSVIQWWLSGTDDRDGSVRV